MWCWKIAWPLGTSATSESGGPDVSPPASPAWTKGGPVVLERCTIAATPRAVSTEDAVAGIELNKCLLVTGIPAKSSVSGARTVKVIDCVDLGTLEEAGLSRPDQNEGTDDKGLISTKHPGYGYQGARANAAK